MPLRPAVRTAVESALGIKAASWTPAAGSSFNETWRVESASGRHFVKIAPAERHDMFAGEAAGLNALAGTGAIEVPAVAAIGTAEGYAYLALQWLDLGPGGRGAALGRALALVHRHSAARFGWHRDNTIGSTAQANGWKGDWPSFWVDRRLRPQLDLARRRGHPGRLDAGERLLSVVPGVLQGHVPVPSLLHGDLWSGNAAETADGMPVVFDPAVYYGDRETDLAMTELFGGFGADFYAAYREAWPVDAGYPARRMLYNLYHVLNHYNLFGGGYGHQAARMIEALLAQAG